MTKNKVFKSDFELYFIDKNENNDFEKKIAEIIDQTIKPRYRYNYLQNLTDINKEVRKHLKSITTYIGNSNYRDAFIFAKLLFEKLNSIIQEANYLSETFLNNTDKTLDTIIFLAEDERVPLALKEKATSFLIKELYNGTNYEYDYYGKKITEASKRICLQLQKEEEYLVALDRILSKKNLSGYDKRIYTAEKISILSQKGDTEGFVNYGLTIKNTKLAVIFIQEGNFVKMSLRSKGNNDVNLFARKCFNGGGHVNAAGGRFDGSIEEAVAYFKQVLPDFIHKNM